MQPAWHCSAAFAARAVAHCLLRGAQGRRPTLHHVGVDFPYVSSLQHNQAGRMTADAAADVQRKKCKRLSIDLTAASHEMFTRMRQIEACGEGLYRFFLLSFLTLDRSWAAALLFSGSVQVAGAVMAGVVFRRRLKLSPAVSRCGLCCCQPSQTIMVATSLSTLLCVHHSFIACKYTRLAYPHCCGVSSECKLPTTLQVSPHACCASCPACWCWHLAGGMQGTGGFSPRSAN